VDQFWRIVAILEQDRDVSPEQWDSLLSTPGYQALTASEFPPEFFKKYFTLAYKPSRQADLDEAMKDPRKKRLLQHLLDVRSKKPELDAQKERLQHEPVLSKALAKTRRLLPEGIGSAEPPVAFVIFDNDGRGYEPIVVDLLASLRWDLEAFLAHESHHWYRNRMLAFDPEVIDSTDEYFVHTLNQLQAEGIADQIDKAVWFDSLGGIPPSKQKYAERFQSILDASPRLIEQFDSLCGLMSGASDSARRQYGEEAYELIPMSGHPTGFYMARLILEAGGADRLIQEAGNPFAFCRLYDEAARRSKTGAPAFSAKALNYIGLLESKYVTGSGD
jgi:hypothetical protein